MAVEERLNRGVELIFYEEPFFSTDSARLIGEPCTSSVLNFDLPWKTFEYTLLRN